MSDWFEEDEDDIVEVGEDFVELRVKWMLKQKRQRLFLVIWMRVEDWKIC